MSRNHWCTVKNKQFIVDKFLLITQLSKLSCGKFELIMPKFSIQIRFEIGVSSTKDANIVNVPAIHCCSRKLLHTPNRTRRRHPHSTLLLESLTMT